MYPIDENGNRILWWDDASYIRYQSEDPYADEHLPMPTRERLVRLITPRVWKAHIQIKIWKIKDWYRYSNLRYIIKSRSFKTPPF